MRLCQEAAVVALTTPRRGRFVCSTGSVLPVDLLGTTCWSVVQLLCEKVSWKVVELSAEPLPILRTVPHRGAAGLS